MLNTENYVEKIISRDELSQKEIDDIKINIIQKRKTTITEFSNDNFTIEYDNNTAIHGEFILPRNFDPQQEYPLVIYLPGFGSEAVDTARFFAGKKSRENAIVVTYKNAGETKDTTLSRWNQDLNAVINEYQKKFPLAGSNIAINAISLQFLPAINFARNDSRIKILNGIIPVINHKHTLWTFFKEIDGGPIESFELGTYDYRYWNDKEILNHKIKATYLLDSVLAGYDNVDNTLQAIKEIDNSGRKINLHLSPDDPIIDIQRVQYELENLDLSGVKLHQDIPIGHMENLEDMQYQIKSKLSELFKFREKLFKLTMQQLFPEEDNTPDKETGGKSIKVTFRPKGHKPLRILGIHPAPLDDQGNIIRNETPLMYRYTFHYLGAWIEQVAREKFDRAIEMVVVDQNSQTIDYSSEWDLVLLSPFTLHIPSARRIAGRFRELDVPTIAGGMHTTAMPEEALSYADRVVLGEGENAVPLILADLIAGELKSIPEKKLSEKIEQRKYGPLPYGELKNIIYPKNNILKSYPNIVMPIDLIETSRGCPNTCSFCNVWYFYKKEFRLRPIEDIRGELQQRQIEFAFIIDDNFTYDEDHALKVSRELKKNNIKWIAQGSLQMSEDLIRNLADNGCMALYLGVESPSEKRLQDLNKSFNFDNLDKIRLIHDCGIVPIISLIFYGDDPAMVENTLNFFDNYNVLATSMYIFTPRPGTVDWVKYKDKLLTENWSHYDTAHVVFDPSRMSAEELQEKYQEIYHTFYSEENIEKRFEKIDYSNEGVARLLNETISGSVFNGHAPLG